MASQDMEIGELVARIERGDIRLPEMQRQYVWRSTRVRDLLDSLYRGYPSGTILTWETDEGVATRDFAIEQDATKQNRFELLLDGQQRLTSLSAIITDKPLLVRGRKRPIDILFNLEHPEDTQIVTEVEETNGTNGSLAEDEAVDANEDELLKRFDQMAFVVYTKKLANQPHWVSVTEVFKEDSDTSFLKKAGVTSMEDPRYDKYVSRLKKLRDIKKYGYRVHTLDRNKSYEEVTEIFVRVNSLGAKLRSSDLALAQITAKWHGALETFKRFEDECQKMDFDLDLSIHLKALVSFASGQSRFRVVGSLTPEKLQENWDMTKEGMRFAINFLKSNVGIDSPVLLSSPFLVITVAFFGHHLNYKLSPHEEHQLRYWVLTSNAKARYSRGSSESFLDQDLAEIRTESKIDGLLQLLKTQVGRLEIYPDDLANRNSRSSYFKTMFLAFREEGAMDWRDQLVISYKHTGLQHALQFHHIFPQALLKKRELSTRIINDICNLAFISGRTNRKISSKEPSAYLPEIVKEIGNDALIRQCIPTSPELWKLNSYDQFLEERRRLIAKRLNDFLGHNDMELQDGN